MSVEICIHLLIGEPFLLFTNLFYLYIPWPGKTFGGAFPLP